MFTCYCGPPRRCDKLEEEDPIALLPKISAGAHSVSVWVTVFRNLVWLVTIATLAIGGVSIWLLTTAGPILAICVAGVAFGIVMFGIGIAAHRSFARSRNTPLGYRIEEATYRYEISAEDITRHSRIVTQKITAKRDNTHIIEGRYRWTGEGRITRTVNKPPAKLIDIELDDPDGWIYYAALLRSPLSRNQTVIFQTEHKMSDVGGRMQPYYSKYIDQYFGDLKIELVFPPSLIVKDSVSVVEERRNGSAIESSRDIPFEIDYQVGYVKAHVPSPRRGRSYVIYWTWSDYEQRIASLQVDPSQAAS